MNLPAADNSYDCVVCVESSHCYPDIDKFLAEVKRVLKPGGTFLFADFRDEQLAELPVLMQQLERSGMDMLKTVDITPNVVEALNNDHKRKVGEICHCPLALRLIGTHHFLSRWRTALHWCHKFCKGLSRCMPSPCAFARRQIIPTEFLYSADVYRHQRLPDIQLLRQPALDLLLFCAP